MTARIPLDVLAECGSASYLDVEKGWSHGRDRLSLLVRRTVARRGRLILYTHDVAAEPTPLGVTPGFLDEALTVLAEHGVPVLTIAEASRHHGLVG